MPRATGEISTLKLGPFIREPTSSALHVYSRLPHGSTAHIQQKGISTQWRERAAAPHSTIIARKWCRHLGSLLVGSRGWQSVCLALEGFDVHVAALLGLSGAGVRRGGGTATARLDRGRRTLPSRTRWPGIKCDASVEVGLPQVWAEHLVLDVARGNTVLDQRASLRRQRRSHHQLVARTRRRRREHHVSATCDARRRPRRERRRVGGEHAYERV